MAVADWSLAVALSSAAVGEIEEHCWEVLRDFHLVEGAVQNSNFEVAVVVVVVDASSSFDLVVQIDLLLLVEAAVVDHRMVVVAFAEGVGIHHRRRLLVVEAFRHVVAVACWEVAEIHDHLQLLLGVVALDSRSFVD